MEPMVAPVTGRACVAWSVGFVPLTYMDETFAKRRDFSGASDFRLIEDSGASVIVRGSVRSKVDLGEPEVGKASYTALGARCWPLLDAYSEGIRVRAREYAWEERVLSPNHELAVRGLFGEETNPFDAEIASYRELPSHSVLRHPPNGWLELRAL